jgi:hypothetical protein
VLVVALLLSCRGNGHVGFSPRANDAGNSVRSMKAIEYISEQLGESLWPGKQDHRIQMKN